MEVLKKSEAIFEDELQDTDLARQHGDGAGHAGLVVPVDQAGKVELAGPVELPDDLALLAGDHMRHVRCAVFHVGKLLHQRGVLLERGLRAQHGLVQQFPLVDDLQAHGVAFTHLDVVGGEAHGVVHAQRQGALHRCGIACHAPGHLLAGGRGAGAGAFAVTLMWRTCMGKRGSSACQHCADSYEFKSVHVGYGLK